MNSGLLKLLCMVNFAIFLQATNIFAQSHCYDITYDWKWSTNTVAYHINSNIQTTYATQQDYETAIRSAASQWTNAGSNFQFTEGSEVNYDKDREPDGTFQVGWSFGDSNDASHGITVISPPNNGILWKVETYFNQNYPISANPSADQYDLYTIILHEFGHWLSLGDETDASCSANVMYQYRSKGDIYRILTDDDKAGIIALYGSGTVGVEDYIFVHSFYEPNPVIYTQNSDNYFWYDFSDQPLTNYIVSDSWSLLIEHGEGEYVASNNFHLGTLPYGYYWYRDANGNERGDF